MKNYILWGLLTFSTAFALCMEQEEVYKKIEAPISPLYAKKVRLRILQALLRLPRDPVEYGSSLKSIQAFSSTHQKAFKFLKKVLKENTKGVTEDLLLMLYKLSYHGYFIIRDLLPKLSPLLKSEELDILINSFQEGPTLVSLFNTCSKNNQWDEVRTYLANVKPAFRASCLGHYYWHSFYMGSFAILRLFECALELNAPLDILTQLKDWGAGLTPLHGTTPSSFLIVCKKLTGKSPKHSQPGAQDDPLKQGIELLELLNTWGASVNDPFFTPNEFLRIGTAWNTPVLIAARSNNKELLDYLFKVGAYFPWESFRAVLPYFMQDKISLPVMETLLTKSDNPQTLFYKILDLCVKEKDREEKKTYIRLLSLLLNDPRLDINAIKESFTPLDIVYQYDKEDNASLIKFLISKGAVTNEKKHESDLEIVNLYHKADAIIQAPRAIEETPNYNAMVSFLKEIQTLSIRRRKESPNRSKGWYCLIDKCLQMALTIDSSFCEKKLGKEFWEFIALNENLSLPVEGYGTITSLFQWLVVELHVHKLLLEEKIINAESYKAFRTQAHEFISSLVAKGAKDTCLPGEKTAVELALCYGMPDSANYIRSLTEIINLYNEANRVFEKNMDYSGMPHQTIIDFLKRVQTELSYNKKLDLEGNSQNVRQLLIEKCLLIAFCKLYLPEAKEFWKFIALHEDLSIPVEGSGTATSVCSLLVLYIREAFLLARENRIDAQIYYDALQKAGSLIVWLFKEEGTDAYILGAETAVQLAIQWNILALAKTITVGHIVKLREKADTIFSRIHPINSLTCSDEEAIIGFLKEVQALLSISKKLHLDLDNYGKKSREALMLKWMYLACEKLHLQGAKEFWKFIALNENLSISVGADEIGADETITSVFQLLVYYLCHQRLLLRKESIQKEDYELFVKKVHTLILWLVDEGVKDICTLGGKTAIQLAIHLDMPDLANYITKAFELHPDVHKQEDGSKAYVD